jgi:potassium-transporting ATPase KdpC subunit
MKPIMIALKLFLIFTVVTGLIYPLLVTGIVQVVFPSQANGSLIIVNNKTVGSALIGQQFDSAVYFTSRPSAIFYIPLPSGGSNYGLTNAKLKNLVVERKKQFIRLNGIDSLTFIPSEMLFASASGLDPHISKSAALLQVERVSKARNLSLVQKQKLVQSIITLTESPQFFCFGEERINVLILNLKLNSLAQHIVTNK